jgi:iron complex outermembrane receptor protein
MCPPSSNRHQTVANSLIFAGTPHLGLRPIWAAGSGVILIMITNKLWRFATTALAGTMLTSGVALAQSTGSQKFEEIVVTGQRNKTVGGAISAEKVAKARSTITQEFIAKQMSGQSVLQQINLLPAVNFTNNDPFGTSGGNIRIRGFDGNRIALTVDGVPLNDTGNYAIFSNQQVDSELLSKVSVNLGSTDVDSPTAAAAGGTVNYSALNAKEKAGLDVTLAAGSYDFGRLFTRIDTGAIGLFGTRIFGAASYTNYNKFKGPGELEKKQYNGQIYQPLNGSDFVALSFKYNENRNNFYRNLTLTQFAAEPKTDNDPGCVRPTPVGGTVQNEGTTTSCTNFYDLRINPSNTGNIRIRSQFSLTDALTLTIDPSFQYVLANGGGYSAVSESDARLRGASTAAGVDLNRDGDTLDTVGLYLPNNTNTRRYGVIAGLIWDINPDHRVRATYTYDYGRHRQTGEASFFDETGRPASIFGGKDGWGPKVRTADGNFLRGRDRFSIAELNQFSAEYRGQFFDGAMVATIGARVPEFKRQLNQFCFQIGGTATCTTGAAPTETVPGTRNSPNRAKVTYDKVLPNVGLSVRPFDNAQIFVSYAETLSAPRTDNLYNYPRAAVGRLNPETGESYDLGFRYQSSVLLGSLTIWKNDFKNRIQTSFDQQLGISVDRQVGDVELKGVDAELGWSPVKEFTLYGSASYNDSKYLQDIPLSATTFAATKGKRLAETPEWTVGGRAEVNVGRTRLGVQGKYVGDRFLFDDNDPRGVAGGYQVYDADVNFNLTGLVPGTRKVEFQLNFTNLFDKSYLGSLGSNTTFSATTTSAVGAPRAMMATLKAGW